VQHKRRQSILVFKSRPFSADDDDIDIDCVNLVRQSLNLSNNTATSASMHVSRNFQLTVTLSFLLLTYYFVCCSLNIHLLYVVTRDASAR